jgi:demethylmenaquinone methyltransferase/2-methoxy-6-polyprenyl-1,4-benzoquinol methylase
VFSYVFMKILERRPASYDRRMDKASRGRVRAMKEAVTARVPPAARVLEIGCGTGELGAMLVARGATVEGFDLSPTMIAAARERIARHGLEDRMSVREMGVDGMDDLPDASFDAVVATLVLSELTDDERRFALRHAARALRPSGMLVLADEVVPRTRAHRLAHAALRAPMAAVTYLVSRGSTRPLADLVGEVTAAGLVVEREERSHRDAFALVVARAVEPAA